MHRIIAITWKDARVRFSSKLELLFFLVLPLVFTFILGGARGQDNQRMPIAVVDADRSILSAALVEILNRDPGLDIRLLPQESARAQYQDRQVTAAVAIPAGFQDHVTSDFPVDLDLQRPAGDVNGDVAERSISSAVAKFNRATKAARLSTTQAEELRPFNSQAEKQAYFLERMAAALQKIIAAPARLQMVQAASEKASLDERAQASVGQLVTWVLLPLLGVSVLFAYERNGRTLQRLLTTPTPKTTNLLSTIVGQLAIAMVQMLLLILFGVYVMHVPWGESPAGLAVMMVSFGLASVAMGTALGTYIKTERQANSLSIMLAQVLALLGGCWWPLEFFPPLMKTFAMALPTYWAMRGFSDLALRGLGMPAVLPEAGILLLYALVFFVIGVRRFRYE
jgi:ABC-2 type transport system permease protein